MKGYKGFEPGLICKGKQYAENTVFEEKSAEIHKSGMHFCEDPFDVLSYYGFVNKNAEINDFAEVKALDAALTNNGKSFCTKKLKIVAKIGITGLVDAFVEFTKSKIVFKGLAATNAGNFSVAASTSDYSAATNTSECSAATNTGKRSAATSAGNCSAATNTGNCSAAASTGKRSAATNTGYCSAATNAGDFSAAASTNECSAAASTGNFSVAASTGNRSAATNAGNFSAAASTGNCSAAASTGNFSVAASTGKRSAAAVEGKESFAIATGVGGKARGKIGCYIAVAEWAETADGYTLKNFRAQKVDGQKIKEDVFYMLKNGKFVEVDDGEDD